MGSARDFDTAKAEFKAAWTVLKARTSPSGLAAAYQAMNIRERRLKIVSGQGRNRCAKYSGAVGLARARMSANTKTKRGAEWAPRVRHCRLLVMCPKNTVLA